MGVEIKINWEFTIVILNFSNFISKKGSSKILTFTRFALNPIIFLKIFSKN